MDRYAEQVMKEAAALYEKDMRIRMRVQSSTAQVWDEWCDRIDWDNVRERDVREMMLQAAVMTAKSILDEDAELLAARAERDHYRAVAERALLVAPMPPIMLIKGEEAPQGFVRPEVMEE